jgi:hypothetical protein
LEPEQVLVQDLDSSSDQLRSVKEEEEDEDHLTLEDTILHLGLNPVTETICSVDWSKTSLTFYELDLNLEDQIPGQITAVSRNRSLTSSVETHSPMLTGNVSLRLFTVQTEIFPKRIWQQRSTHCSKEKPAK